MPGNDVVAMPRNIPPGACLVALLLLLLLLLSSSLCVWPKDIVCGVATGSQAGGMMMCVSVRMIGGPPVMRSLPVLGGALVGISPTKSE